MKTILFITTYSGSSITGEALHLAAKSQYQELNESWSVVHNMQSGAIAASTNNYKVAIGW